MMSLLLNIFVCVGGGGEGSRQTYFWTTLDTDASPVGRVWEGVLPHVKIGNASRLAQGCKSKFLISPRVFWTKRHYFSC